MTVLEAKRVAPDYHLGEVQIIVGTPEDCRVITLTWPHLICYGYTHVLMFRAYETQGRWIDIPETEGS